MVSKEREIDVLLLAESTLDPNDITIALNSESVDPYYYSENFVCEKVHMFSKFKHTLVKNVGEDSRTVIKQIDAPVFGSFLLVITHFPSKMGYSDVSQSIAATRLYELIKDAEFRTANDKTVLVGDLNMNPFESGVVAAGALHAVMTRTIASKARRTVLGEDYAMFYNPMWRLMGDETRGPPGTIYYSSSEHVNYFWNLFDQVLLRPSIMERFSESNLEIVTKIGTTSLVTSSGLPDKSNISDHLPLYFVLE
nr:endonuclease/exonuclease/phosphatase family protein [Deinococcus pimensis]